MRQLPILGIPRGGQSLSDVNPELAKQWHPDKNGDLTPYDVLPGSNVKVWWKCPVDDEHVWENDVRHRRTKGQALHPTFDVTALTPLVARAVGLPATQTEPGAISIARPGPINFFTRNQLGILSPDLTHFLRQIALLHTLLPTLSTPVPRPWILAGCPRRRSSF